jgi:hypothetical protein
MAAVLAWNPRLELSIASIIFPVPVPLHEIASTSPCSGSYQRALLPADQCAADCAGNSTDNRALGFAVVMPVRSAMRRGVRDSAQYQKHNNQKHRNDVLFSYSLYHYHPPFSRNARI